MTLAPFGAGRSNARPAGVRSADRDWNQPSIRGISYGIRPSRTYPSISLADLLSCRNVIRALQLSISVVARYGLSSVTRPPGPSNSATR